MIAEIVRKYYKVVLAQAGGYALAWYLVTYVFIGPLPVVSPSFKRNVAESPRAIARTASEVPERINSFASGVISSAQGQPPAQDAPSQTQSGYVPAPWVPSTSGASASGSGGQGQPPVEPTQAIAPTSAPIVLPTAAPFEGSQGSVQPTAQPQPTTRPFIPQPTRIPPPTAIILPTIPVSLAQKEQETINEINKRRKAVGAPAVRAQGSLAKAARLHAVWMSGGTGSSRCSHTGSGGSDPGDRARSAGYRGYTSEVIGCGYTSAASAVQGWMDSPPHKAIMLGPSRREIGVGWSGGMVVGLFGG